jgi:holdfast attachment protein HfaA
MSHAKKTLFLAVLGGCLAVAAPAGAYDWTNSGSYNGYGASNQNTPSNYSLRDANGNLTNVNGQFTSSTYAMQSGSQYAGVGTSGAGAGYGQASAIGNSLNVVTLGSNNTVIVDSTQTNNGNQTATVDLNSH